MAYTTINKSSEHFNTKLYTGTDSAQTVTGVEFQPDFTWIKCRNYGGSGSFNHVLNDVVRGVGEVLVSNSTSAANSSYDYGSLASFNNDGFTTVAGGTSIDGVGGGARTYASWNWKANGAGSANTDGSISSTVSANTTSGFSIVSYTGTGANASIGHGLGVAPKVVLIKSLSSTEDWSFYFLDTSVASNNVNNYLELNTTNASAGDSGARFGVYSNFTTSTFGVGNDNATNASGSNYIAYCFVDVQGYSKIGKYTGNGNADGSFIYTGFSPAFVMVKRTDSTSDWTIFDNKRPGYNLINKALYPNGNWAEGTGDALDFTSNGFKWRVNSSAYNGSGGDYIYMAFAEAPLVGTNNVPTNAR